MILLSAYLSTCDISVEFGGAFFLKPFRCQWVLHRRVKSSGVRQSKIYKCSVGTYRSERVNREFKI